MDRLTHHARCGGVEGTSARSSRPSRSLPGQTYTPRNVLPQYASFGDYANARPLDSPPDCRGFCGVASLAQTFGTTKAIWMAEDDVRLVPTQCSDPSAWTGGGGTPVVSLQFRRLRLCPADVRQQQIEALRTLCTLADQLLSLRSRLEVAEFASVIDLVDPAEIQRKKGEIHLLEMDACSVWLNMHLRSVELEKMDARRHRTNPLADLGADLFELIIAHATSQESSPSLSAQGARNLRRIDRAFAASATLARFVPRLYFVQEKIVRVAPAAEFVSTAGRRMITPYGETCAPNAISFSTVRNVAIETISLPLSAAKTACERATERSTFPHRQGRGESGQSGQLMGQLGGQLMGQLGQRARDAPAIVYRRTITLQLRMLLPAVADTAESARRRSTSVYDACEGARMRLRLVAVAGVNADGEPGMDITALFQKRVHLETSRIGERRGFDLALLNGRCGIAFQLNITSGEVAKLVRTQRANRAVDEAALRANLSQYEREHISVRPVASGGRWSHVTFNATRASNVGVLCEPSTWRDGLLQFVVEPIDDDLRQITNLTVRCEPFLSLANVASLSAA